MHDNDPDKPPPQCTITMALDMAIMALQHECSMGHTGQDETTTMMACQVLDTLREVMSRPNAHIIFNNRPLELPVE